MTKLDILKFAVKLYPCPDYKGENVVITIEEGDKNYYIIKYSDKDDKGCFTHYFHVQRWIRSIFLFTNVSTINTYIINE